MNLKSLQIIIGLCEQCIDIIENSKGKSYQSDKEYKDLFSLIKHYFADEKGFKKVVRFCFNAKSKLRKLQRKAIVELENYKKDKVIKNCDKNIEEYLDIDFHDSIIEKTEWNGNSLTLYFLGNNSYNHFKHLTVRYIDVKDFISDKPLEDSYYLYGFLGEEMDVEMALSDKEMKIDKANKYYYDKNLNSVTFQCADIIVKRVINNKRLKEIETYLKDKTIKEIDKINDNTGYMLDFIQNLKNSISFGDENIGKSVDSIIEELKGIPEVKIKPFDETFNIFMHYAPETYSGYYKNLEKLFNANIGFVKDTEDFLYELRNYLKSSIS